MFSLKVETRDANAQSNNSLRKVGLVPAVYYHKGEPSEALKISLTELKKAMSSHEAVIQLSNKKMAIVKEIQRDPVSSKIVHVSLQGVVAGEKFHKSVPIVCAHEDDCSWQKQGMILIQTLNHIEIETTPENVPESIVVDVSTLQKGHVLRLKEVVAPKGVRFMESEDTQVAHVTYPHVEEEKAETTTPVAETVAPSASSKKDE